METAIATDVMSTVNNKRHWNLNNYLDLENDNPLKLLYQNPATGAVALAQTNFYVRSRYTLNNISFGTTGNVLINPNGFLSTVIVSLELKQFRADNGDPVTGQVYAVPGFMYRVLRNISYNIGASQGTSDRDSESHFLMSMAEVDNGKQNFIFDCAGKTGYSDLGSTDPSSRTFACVLRLPFSSNNIKYPLDTTTLNTPISITLQMRDLEDCLIVVGDDAATRQQRLAAYLASGGGANPITNAAIETRTGQLYNTALSIKNMMAAAPDSLYTYSFHDYYPLTIAPYTINLTAEQASGNAPLSFSINNQQNGDLTGLVFRLVNNNQQRLNTAGNNTDIVNPMNSLTVGSIVLSLNGQIIYRSLNQKANRLFQSIDSRGEPCNEYRISSRSIGNDNLDTNGSSIYTINLSQFNNFTMQNLFENTSRMAVQTMLLEVTLSGQSPSDGVNVNTPVSLYAIGVYNAVLSIDSQGSSSVEMS